MLYFFSTENKREGRYLLAFGRQDPHCSVHTGNDELLSVLAPVDTRQEITVLVTLDQQFPRLVLVNPRVRSNDGECLSREVELERHGLNVPVEVDVGRV